MLGAAACQPTTQRMRQEAARVTDLTPFAAGSQLSKRTEIFFSCASDGGNLTPASAARNRSNDRESTESVGVAAPPKARKSPHASCIAARTISSTDAPWPLQRGARQASGDADCNSKMRRRKLLAEDADVWLQGMHTQESHD